MPGSLGERIGERARRRSEGATNRQVRRFGYPVTPTIDTIDPFPLRFAKRSRANRTRTADTRVSREPTSVCRNLPGG
jgi:hypothetical protein